MKVRRRKRALRHGWKVKRDAYRVYWVTTTTFTQVQRNLRKRNCVLRHIRGKWSIHSYSVRNVAFTTTLLTPPMSNNCSSLQCSHNAHSEIAVSYGTVPCTLTVAHFVIVVTTSSQLRPTTLAWPDHAAHLARSRDSNMPIQKFYLFVRMIKTVFKLALPTRNYAGKYWPMKDEQAVRSGHNSVTIKYIIFSEHKCTYYLVLLQPTLHYAHLLQTTASLLYIWRANFKDKWMQTNLRFLAFPEHKFFGFVKTNI